MGLRVVSTVTATVAALALLVGWSAASSGAATAVATEASVDLLECNHGRRSASRNALFRGEMRQLPNGAAMRMRFELEERVGRGDWRAVAAPGLRVWRDAKPGIGVFAYRQRIAGLQKGTTYRVKVVFQWRDASGTPIAKQSARSSACRQGGQLPNLRVGRLERFPGPTLDTVRYVAAIVNGGRGIARRVQVSLLVDGAEVDTHGIGTLRGRSRREVGFVGPACANLVTVRADPADKLRESNEQDNVRSFACPPPA
jgi:hypothetical protein